MTSADAVAAVRRGFRIAFSRASTPAGAERSQRAPHRSRERMHEGGQQHDDAEEEQQRTDGDDPDLIGHVGRSTSRSMPTTRHGTLATSERASDHASPPQRTGAVVAEVVDGSDRRDPRRSHRRDHRREHGHESADRECRHDGAVSTTSAPSGTLNPS